MLQCFFRAPTIDTFSTECRKAKIKVMLRRITKDTKGAMSLSEFNATVVKCVKIGFGIAPY